MKSEEYKTMQIVSKIIFQHFSTLIRYKWIKLFFRVKYEIL